jgi:50S ribosomal protein L16 3-hydroxylase
MDIDSATPLLGGMSPHTFMRQHWQKKPLLIRGAVADGLELLSRAQLFELVAQDGVESRLIEQKSGAWSLRHGPFQRRAIPPLKQSGWTLLVQGLDLHANAAHHLLALFRFIPDARLDDLMLSFATDGGGVGPHIDSYDVFLLQTAGFRRWRIASCAHPEWVPNVPLKLLAQFEPEEEWLLGPGDMLYLPPGWAHEGVAQGECFTASIGFRAPAQCELGHALMQRILEEAQPELTPVLYGDCDQPATGTPAHIPPALQAFAFEALQKALANRQDIQCALGELLTEPKPQVWFEPPRSTPAQGLLTLHAKTRMLYDEHHVFINGEAFKAAGHDAKLMRCLADRRCLSQEEQQLLTLEARQLLSAWADDGWLTGSD